MYLLQNQRKKAHLFNALFPCFCTLSAKKRKILQNSALFRNVFSLPKPPKARKITLASQRNPPHTPKTHNPPAQAQKRREIQAVSVHTTPLPPTDTSQPAALARWILNLLLCHSSIDGYWVCMSSSPQVPAGRGELMLDSWGEMVDSGKWPFLGIRRPLSGFIL